MNESKSRTLARLKIEFREIGYVGGLLREDYAFAQVLSDESQVTSIPLAAFAQEPPSYRNACFGVVAENGNRGVPLVEQCRSLGAPQILEIRDGSLLRWRMTSLGAPEALEEVGLGEIPGLFKHHRQEWAPQRVLNVKTARDAAPVQLDFFDLGLLPLIEREVRSKLDRLLRNTVTLAVEALKQRRAFHGDADRRLFRLLFRLIAAKVLGDRGHPGSWLPDDAGQAISEVENFYFKESGREPVLDDQDIQNLVWRDVRRGFQFQNLSVDALAYVYENTLVTIEARRTLGIHGTPPEIAEYITAHLPIESVPQEERRIFEPFSGHAVFLVAAMQRLRDLLPPSSTPEERHNYFVRMLAGLEVDEFAREVAMLSLMLADYPNPDGWRLYSGDVFASPVFDQELGSASVVLSNPPFEDFAPSTRAHYQGLSSAHKPAELLYRVLQKRPRMLGVVLPRIFIHGRGYRQIRQELRRNYGSLDILALPDRVFQHSEADVVVLLAYEVGAPTSRLTVGEVYEHDLDSFYATHKRSYAADISPSTDSSEVVSSGVWLGPLDEVWKATERLVRIGDISEIHRGIEFSVPFEENRDQLISDRPKPGYSKGLHRVEESLEPFRISDTVHLNMSRDLQRGHAYELDWSRPKVIVNAVRRTRGHWKVTAAPDNEGLVCYQNFHAIWPRDMYSLETLAAVLNGPVANAFVASHEAQRHIRIGTLKSVPIPRIEPEQSELITSLVRDYSETCRILSLEGPSEELLDRCRRLLMQIDAEVLKTYDLPPRLERVVLDYFRGHSRPAPVRFDEYLPADFMPYLPLHRYISREVATAKSTLGRLPILRDRAVSEALSQVD